MLINGLTLFILLKLWNCRLKKWLVKFVPDWGWGDMVWSQGWLGKRELLRSEGGLWRSKCRVNWYDRLLPEVTVRVEMLTC